MSTKPVKIAWVPKERINFVGWVRVCYTICGMNVQMYISYIANLKRNFEHDASIAITFIYIIQNWIVTPKYHWKLNYFATKCDIICNFFGNLRTNVQFGIATLYTLNLLLSMVLETKCIYETYRPIKSISWMINDDNKSIWTRKYTIASISQ